MAKKANLKASLVILVLLLGTAGAVTYYVDPNGSADFNTIQEAIYAANDYDEIEVAPETYNEAINFNGMAIRLYSRDGQDVTIIDGTGHYHVVQCISGEDANTILEGFTITGGNANGTEPNDRRGGGMFNYNSSPTVLGCTFYRNFTGDGSPGTGDGGDGGDASDGAGMFNYNSSPIVTNCTFSENVTGAGGTAANGADGGYCQYGHNGGNGGKGGNGAGMYNENSSPQLSFCTFSQNRTGNGGNGGDGGSAGDCIGPFNDDGYAGIGNDGGNGAGIYNFNSSPVISNCQFTDNTNGIGGMSGSRPYVFSPVYSNNGGNGGNGAGIYNEDSMPVITDCTFHNNNAGVGNEGAPAGRGGHGGAIFNGGNSIAVIDHSLFLNNKTGAGSLGCDQPGNAGDGGGIYNIDGASAVVTDCNFSENKTGHGGNGQTTGWEHFSGGHGGHGGGIYNGSNCEVTIIGCVFGNNMTGEGGDGPDGGTWLFSGWDGGDGGNGGDGAGIYNATDCNAVVSNCAFTQNSTGGGGLAGKGGWGLFHSGSPGRMGKNGGGGGMANHKSSAVLSNCTFRGNSAGHGGGMYNSERNPTVTNCTFRQNLGKIDGGGIYTSGGSPTVTNCILWEDEPNEIAGTEPNVTYCDIEMSSGTYPGTGNINAVPVFADDAGRLSLGSACVDAGSNSAPNLPAKDFDGNPRIIGGIVDMGAFEYTDLRIRNVTKDILYASIQSAIDDADDGDEICVLPGTYFSAIDFKGKAVRLYSTSGPDFTTIDGSGAYHVVQCISGEDANTILEGFTITGGNANGSSAPDNCGGGMLNSGSSPKVLNCLFMGNAATSGGGMDNENSSPTVTNCTFASNTTSGGGGGMRNAYSSHPAVTRCTFESNTASTHGGGMVNVLSSSPTITNCTFSGNTASGLGGGIINSVGCSPTIVNCIFGSNQAENGGGMFNNDNSNPIVTNCNFLYNSASVNGGGMYNSNNSNPTVTNCIFWDDYAPDEISNDSSSPVVTYCDVKMPSGTYPGIGNINADPNFSGAIIMGRPECSNYLSSSASPCADAGDNNAPNLPGTDMGGQPRVIDGDVDGNSTVDMGAYELQPCVKNVTRNRWYQLIQHSVEDACDYDRIEVPPGTYYESVDFMNAPNNFILTSIDPNDPNIVEQTIIDAKFGGHVLTFTSQGSSCIVAGFTLTVSGNPLMVPGFGYGIGSYGQITSPTITNCVITNTRGVSFDSGSPVISGCTIRENFGGVKVGDNAIIEDCIIANNFAIESQGLYCVVETGWGNTILRRCVVSGNQCEYAAISCMGDTTIEDCVISDNTGMMGAVWSSGSPSAGKISGCTISNNKGGGINGWAGPIENSIITGNAGEDIYAIMTGGGIRNCTGSITGCVIRGNKALDGGGLGFCSGSIANCIISGNQGIHGGGLHLCNGAISNCTIVGNIAWDGPSPDVGMGGGLYQCNGTISNSIIWQNWAETAGDQIYSCSEPNYSCIQDWAGGGTGNISADPCFVYPGHWGDFNDPNIVLEPNEPNAVWVNGFYRLSWASPCIDAGDNAAVPGGVTTDLSGLPRFIDDLCTVDTGDPGILGPPVVDMGAYEFLPADIDGSGAVDLRDFSEFALHWAETGCGRCGGANMTCDGNVDWNDLRVLTDWWLTGTEPEL